jgi:hypothetical protein
VEKILEQLFSPIPDFQGALTLEKLQSPVFSGIVNDLIETHIISQLPMTHIFNKIRAETTFYIFKRVKLLRNPTHKGDIREY